MTTPPSPSNPAPRALSRTLERHPRPLGGDPTRNTRASVSLSAMVLNNQPGVAHHLAVKKKPDWLRAKAPGGAGFRDTSKHIQTHALHTVCSEASCPNIGECWARGVATIMILGDVCTRSCGFCNVKSGKPPVTDLDEPRRVADSLKGSGLKHIVITSVDRDDLPDGGAAIWAETIRRVRDACPDLRVEVLIGDFKGEAKDLQKVIDAKPHIIAHNLETVRRCHPAVRPSAQYERSIEVLARVKAAGMVAKTGIMVGIGERKDEVFELFDDIIRLSANPAGDACELMTIGQYLQPTRNHLPIDRWVHPDEFAEYERAGLEAGFKSVFSGPLVRSSYLADVQVEGLDL